MLYLVRRTGSSGPERMTSLYPLPLYQSLKAVQCPGVGVQYDLGQAGHSEGHVAAGQLSQQHWRLNLLQALGCQA